MATLSVLEITRAGVDVGAVAAGAGGDEFANTGEEFLYVKNADASGKVVTIVTQQTIDGQAVADRTVSVAASEEKFIGPFQTSVYNDTDGLVQVTYDDVTSVTVRAVKLARVS